MVQRVTTSGTTSGNGWYNKWQRVTTNDNEWYNEWHRMTRSDEWQVWPNFLSSNNMVLLWVVLHFITPEATAGSSGKGTGTFWMKGENRKMVKKPLSYNANAFFRLKTFTVAKKLEIKVTPSLNRVKDFLLENHGFEFCRADSILCGT